MKFKKIMIMTLSLCLLLVTGCGKIPKLENGQELVVEMKDKKITVDELYSKMKNAFARDILIEMIDRAILDEKYKTDESLDTQIKSQIESIKSQTGENFLATIKSQAGLNSEEELYSYLELSLKRNKAIDDYVKTTITDKEIEDYYNTKTVGDIKASHILIKPKTTSSMTAEEKSAKETEALNLAKEIITKLNNGEDFAKLAKDNSDDEGSASKGGDLGWFNKGVMDESFEQAAFALEKGKYSTTPVKSAFGYHIILKVDVKDKAKLKDAKETIVKNLVSDKLEADTTLNYKALIELRKDNKLVIHDSELKKQYDDYMNELTKK